MCSIYMRSSHRLDTEFSSISTVSASLSLIDRMNPQAFGVVQIRIDRRRC